MEHNPYQAPSADLYGMGTGDGEGVTDGVLRALRGTKGWVRLISVMFFVGAVLMFLGGLVMLGMTLIGGSIAAASNEAGAAAAALGGVAGAGVVGVVYVLLGGLYIYPALKLWAYASGIDRLLNDRSSLHLEKALDEQRRFWKFTGILILLMLALYALVLLGAMVFAGLAVARG